MGHPSMPNSILLLLACIALLHMCGLPAGVIAVTGAAAAVKLLRMLHHQLMLLPRLCSVFANPLRLFCVLSGHRLLLRVALLAVGMLP
jgi:hypothetical protein